MAGNPKDSKWYATPRTARARKGIEVTLSEAARDKLEELARGRGVSRSQVIEALVLAAKR